MNNQDGNQIIKEVWSEIFAPADRRPIYEWAADNLELPAAFTRTGKFDVSVSRHFIGPFTALKDDAVREVNILAPPRSGKTLIGDIYLMWTICNDPGPFRYVFQDDSVARVHSKDRILPLLKTCDKIKLLIPDDQYSISIQEMKLNNGVDVHIKGPAIGKLQSKGFKFVVMDELWLYKPGIIEQARSRVGDFLKMQSSKILCISQGGVAGDDWHTQFCTGELREWTVPCLGCGEYFIPVWFAKTRDGKTHGINYKKAKSDDGRRTLKNGSICYICGKCGYRHENEHRTKVEWNERGKYSIGSRTVKRVSFKWNNIIDFPWDELVEAWLSASDQRDIGNDMKQTTFLQKQMSEFYDQNKFEDGILIPEIYVDETSDGRQWEHQDVIFLSIDVQQTHFWGLVEAWNKDGRSMVLFADRLETWGEIEAVQERFSVPQKSVIVDMGYQQNEVGFECSLRGWVCMKGDEKAGFPYIDKRGRRGLRPWTEKRYYNPVAGQHSGSDKLKRGTGKKVPYYSWSNPSIKDICYKRRELMKTNKLAYKSDTVGQAFDMHVHGERKVCLERPNRAPEYKWVKIGRRPNHLWDCWCQSTVAAGIAGILMNPLSD